MALLHTHIFSYALLGKDVSCEVILPQGDIPEYGYRTVWLLHGMSDDETIWERRTRIECYADAHHIAVVMPAAELSCYSDMAHGLKFYTYITKELPSILRGIFPLSSRREDNYIAGLSMGGEGAMKLGLANPTQYACIGCLSAGAFNHPWKEKPKLLLERIKYLCHDGKNLQGLPEDCFSNAEKILTEHLPVPRIYHAIGTSDFLLEAARETRQFFTSLDNDPFDYTYEEDPGAHTWDFWEEHIKRFLDFVDGTY